ncbi:MAG TPA: CBS domain-containing protein [Actinoplanes sp.]|nr:CBS domain-containing protein [Actinoplanes sp.]
MSSTRRPGNHELVALKGRTLRVPELLAMFGERVRNFQNVPMIQNALQDAGVDTHPSFTTCGLTTDILVVALSAIPSPENDEDEVQPGTLPQQSFKIGDIPSARSGVESVKSTASLSSATHTMRQKKYSQLPVIDGIADLKGVVTWSSIAARYEMGEIPTLATAMIRDDLAVAEMHQELFGYLTQLSQHGYLLVRANNGKIAGIITGSDITARFHTLALPFFLVGEIESRLRLCLGPKLTGAPVQSLGPKHSDGDFSKLMFGEYLRLLDGDQQNPNLRVLSDENWKCLGWGGVDRIQFVAQLNRVRVIRNHIAHFDEEPLSPQQLDELSEFSGLLKQLL